MFVYQDSITLLPKWHVLKMSSVERTRVTYLSLPYLTVGGFVI